MQLGIHILRYDPQGGSTKVAGMLAQVAQASEAVGAVSLTLMDHYFQAVPGTSADEPMLEGYTTLGFLAAHTSTVRLGLQVTGVTYRHPGLLAKLVTTVDVLSGGRADLGIGAAWFEREHIGLGVPFPPLAERFVRLEETLQICLQMWSPDDGPFRGQYYQLAETICQPAPLSQPHPPLLVGGGGERKTLRLVARYADLWNISVRGLSSGGTDPFSVLEHKREVLRGHCDEAGRDFDELTMTITYPGAKLREDPKQFLDEMARFAQIGVRRVIVTPESAENSAAWIESVCGSVMGPLGQIDASAPY
jgi:F420-dependent oxidoreductase-like protein